MRGPSADDPDAFIFPARGGGFIDSGNYRNRVLHRLAKELGLPKLTFQVIRRTIATLAKDKGHVKDIQECCATPAGYDHGCLYAVARKRRPVYDRLHSRRVERDRHVGTRFPGVPVQTRAGSRNGPLPSSPVSGNEAARFEACPWGGFGVCDKNATSGRKEMGLSSLIIW